MGIGTALVASALIGAGASMYSSHRQSQAAKAQARAQEEAAKLEAQAAKEAAANTPQDQQDAMSASIRDEEARKIRMRRGMTGTILTSPLGTSGVSSASNKLGVM